MTKIRFLAAALLAAAAILFIASPAGADDDLNCGDPGTTPNMSVPAGDPDGLDGDGDGIGCEDDDSENTPTPTTVVAEPVPTTTAPPTTQPQQLDELPRTGASSNIRLGMLGMVLLATGGVVIAGRNRLRSMAS